MRKPEIVVPLICTVLCALMMVFTLTYQGSTPAYAQRPSDAGEIFQAGVDGVGATLTLLKAAPPLPMRMYITDIYAQSTTGTSGQYILKYGDAKALDPANSATCGTNTTSLLPSAATAVRFNYPLFTGAGVKLQWQTPLVVPPGKDLCVLGIATNLVVMEITGRIYP